MQVRKHCPRGFTIIELLIALVVLGILASTAVPRYMDISTNAKISVCKGLLAGIRSALYLQYTEAKVRGLTQWPTLAQVQDNRDNTGSQIMLDGNLPDNPFSNGRRRDLVRVVHGKPQPAGTQGAWAYDPNTGHFWADTNSGNGEGDF